MITSWLVAYGNRLFVWLEKIAGRRGLACVLAALIPIVIRLMCLLAPAFAVPEPSTNEEVSYLLAGDTFAKGRLTNPAHPMWVHFETRHENMTPTYMSEYPPAQGLFLALGQKLGGHPWYGVLISFGVMGACLCWMFQGWMPPVYAFLGTLLAMGQLGILGSWMNTYAGGTVAAAGGCLVLGAVPRMATAPTVGVSALGAIGVLLLANTRPFEGLVMVAACGALLLWQRARRGRPIRDLLSPRCLLPFVMICGAGVVWMGYYNLRVTGKALTSPSAANNKTYAMPVLWFLPAPKPVSYRNAGMRRFYEYWLDTYKKIRANPLRKFAVIPGILPFYWSALLFFATAAGAVMSRSVKFWSALGVWFIVWLTALAPVSSEARYIAGGTGAAFVGALYGVRWLRVYAKGFGRALVLLVVAIPFTVGLVYGIVTGHVPDLDRRRTVEAGLVAQGGRHLVIVKHRPDRPAWLSDWVFNAADIDPSPVVWARDLGETANRELLDYYRGRKVWLLQPDASLQPQPYPGH